MNAIERAKNILISPVTEWRKIDSETTSVQQLITGYLVPLSLIGAIASFIGWGLVGYTVLGVHHVNILWGGILALVVIAHNLVTAILGMYLINGLAPTFKSERNLRKSARLVIYSYTPHLFAGIFLLIPSPFLTFLGILASIYGLYLIFTGLHIIKKTPDDQRVSYIIATVLTLIAVYVISGVAIDAISDYAGRGLF